MATVDQLVAEAQSDDAELKADAVAVGSALNANQAQIASLQATVASLQNQLASGTAISAQQLTDLETALDSINATHSTLMGSLPTATQTAAATAPAAPATPDAPVTPVDGGTPPAPAPDPATPPADPAAPPAAPTA